MSAFYNPDRYMSELRQVLAGGRKRIGLLLGAGASASLKTDADAALIPAVAELSTKVEEKLETKSRKVLDAVRNDLASEADPHPNIEQILSRLRSLSAIIGSHEMHGADYKAFQDLVKSICDKIGSLAGASLPGGSNAFTELAAWIGGTERAFPIEVFTTNYDLLIEEALERAEIPFFDGFTGSREPFFDSASIARDDLPSRWARVWKLHGSIGWTESGGSVVRTGNSEATNLIYPDHLKYDRIRKLPFTALFDRLRTFLLLPDTLLISSGFSYADAHVSAIIDECLSANPSASVFAFQFGDSIEGPVETIARKRTNMSVYSKHAAQINAVEGSWSPGDLPVPEWGAIRSLYWDDKQGSFQLGDFTRLARFISLVRSEQPDKVDGDDERGRK